MRRLLILLAVSASAPAAGCGGSGPSMYVAGVPYHEPALAQVSPDVYVVVDHDEPVFYTANIYWLYRNNRWYRSIYYDRGWTFNAQPPRAITGIRDPYGYVGYRRGERTRISRDLVPQQVPMGV